MKCSDIIGKLETLAPLHCACEWDNVGLLVGRREKEVKKVYIALDATDEVVEEAVLWGADMLLTHHPLIFKPLKKVSDEDFVARRVMKLIFHDISYYAMHTNFDGSPGCMADAAAEKLSLSGLKVLEKGGVLETAEGEVTYGIGKTGYLGKEMTVRELAEYVKERFRLPFVTFYGGENQTEKVQFIAISPGAGGSMVKAALEAGVKVLITGDIGHHTGIDAAANHLSIIDAGHYGLEYLFLDYMEEYLKQSSDDSLMIRKADVRFPETVL